MRERKLILDTSIIGGYYDVEFEKETKILFEDITKGEFNTMKNKVVGLKIRKIINYQLFIVHCSLFIFLFSSCIKRNQYPIEPCIEFVSFEKIDNGTGIDNEGILTISYTDGDGDLGNLDEKDSTTNYFIIYQEKQNGIYVIPEDTIGMFNASLPRFVSTDKKQPIDGTIQRKLHFNNPYSSFDTIRFECWIVDRAKHKSNHIFTSEIIVKK